MTASRLFSAAAIAAFASFGAQASDLYGANFEAGFQSTRDRAAVQTEAVPAVSQFKDFTPASQWDRASAATTREAVRAEAVTAARSGTIAIGERG